MFNFEIIHAFQTVVNFFTSLFDFVENFLSAVGTYFAIAINLIGGFPPILSIFVAFTVVCSVVWIILEVV